jgi:hypothetical protein
MKKSVIILIFLIYAASIAMVGFLGLQAKSYNDVIYAESLEIINDYKVDSNTGNKYIVFNPTDKSDKTLQLECKVLPDNTSDKKIIYSLDPECKTATIDENGLLTFTAETTRPISVKVYIYAHQNTTISHEILVYYVP